MPLYCAIFSSERGEIIRLVAFDFNPRTTVYEREKHPPGDV
jgi:hypothetical protein